MKNPAEVPLRWVPLAGDIEVVDSASINFNGKEFIPSPPPEPSPSESNPRPNLATVGLVKSDRRISDGNVKATVRFRHVSDRSCCELAVIGPPDTTSRLPSPPRHIFSAGLGAGGSAFGIREFGPGEETSSDGASYNWHTRRFAGERSFLKNDRDYEVEVSLTGGQISLFVDQVPVLAYNPVNLAGQSWNVGLFFLDYDLVSVTRIEVRTEKPRAFVVMRLDGEYEDLYRFVIREVCEEFDVTTIKADEISRPGSVIDDISREIERSRLIIADISAIPPDDTNANVFFEVGYAYALRKPVILLARKGTPLPFDVRSFRVLFYEDSIGGKARLDDSLKRYVNEILFGVGSAIRSEKLG